MPVLTVFSFRRLYKKQNTIANESYGVTILFPTRGQYRQASSYWIKGADQYETLFMTYNGK